jgi:uncharacterized protein YecE (DUF72 family)
MTEQQTNIRIGTSGYQYDHWKGVFYPEGMPKKEWLRFYCTRFDTVEINNTFYQLPPGKTFEGWYDEAPAGFCFALKYSRYGSHLKHLKDPQEHIPKFLERARRLKRRLGPILVQLPPSWRMDAERLAGFLAAAPREHRWALEFRHPSWLCEETYNVLRKHNSALCIHDMIEDHPREVTADWVYLRYHGRDGGDYPHQALVAEARHIHEYRVRGLDVFAYFNNDAFGYALSNAADLKRYLED